MYDGNRSEQNPDARLVTRVRTSYSLPPEEADDRIALLARQALERGEKVVVVSSDRATLGTRLPDVVVQVDPDTLFGRMQERTAPGPGRAIPAGDFSDIEAHFLRAEAEDREARAQQRVTRRSLPHGSRTDERPGAALSRAESESATPGASRGEQRGVRQRGLADNKMGRPGRAGKELGREHPVPRSDREALERKKARGLKKQQRRLAARAEQGGRSLVRKKHGRHR